MGASRYCAVDGTPRMPVRPDSAEREEDAE